MLNQIDVFNSGPEKNSSLSKTDVFTPEIQLPINVNGKTENGEANTKHMPKELEDYPI